MTPIQSLQQLFGHQGQITRKKFLRATLKTKTYIFSLAFFFGGASWRGGTVWM